MPFNVVSIGDFMTGENAHHYKRGIPTKFRNKYHELISEEVRKVLTSADLLFLNFESSLAKDEALHSYPIEQAVYVAPLESVRLLKDLKVKIVANIANNHFAQHGTQSCDYTVDQLKSNGIYVIGKSNDPLVLSINQTKVKIWGVSLVEDKAAGIDYFKSTYDSLINDLQLTKKEEGEYRILSIHWGKEYHTIEDAKQKELAIKLEQDGFDLILGHHPHTIQPVERLNNSVVLYSHGNFIFDQNFSSLTQVGLISKITVPENKIELYMSQQKNFKVVRLVKVTVDELKRFCIKNFSTRKPIKMRILMKLELLTHFYELNLSTIKLFSNRLYKLIR